MPARRRPQARSVFVNCPFDREYKDLFNALVFAVHDCGFFVRCALEINAGQLRLQTICNLIRACRYGIHDLSRTQLGPDNRLPPVQHAAGAWAFPRRQRVWSLPEV